MDTLQQYYSASPQATRELAGRLARVLVVGDVLLLRGTLGAGKTEFVKGLAEEMGVTERVTSPTFALLNVYQGTVPVYHFDLYRLEHPEELFDIGFGEFLGGDGVAVVEWPDRFPAEMPTEYVGVEILEGHNPTERILRMKTVGARYEGRLEGSEFT